MNHKTDMKIKLFHYSKLIHKTSIIIIFLRNRNFKLKILYEHLEILPHEEYINITKIKIKTMFSMYNLYADHTYRRKYNKE